MGVGLFLLSRYSIRHPQLTVTGSYFKRRRLITNQVIEKELEDGGLIISARVGHVNQILPIVRYWIPNIRIISPESLQVEMDKGLEDYLKQNESPRP